MINWDVFWSTLPWAFVLAVVLVEIGFYLLRRYHQR